MTYTTPTISTLDHLISHASCRPSQDPCGRRGPAIAQISTWFADVTLGQNCIYYDVHPVQT